MGKRFSIKISSQKRKLVLLLPKDLFRELRKRSIILFSFYLFVFPLVSELLSDPLTLLLFLLCTFDLICDTRLDHALMVALNSKAFSSVLHLLVSILGTCMNYGFLLHIPPVAESVLTSSLFMPFPVSILLLLAELIRVFMIFFACYSLSLHLHLCCMQFEHLYPSSLL